MNLRWQWFDHIPPELALTREQRADVKRLARAHAMREPNFGGAATTYRRFVMPICIPIFMFQFFMPQYVQSVGVAVTYTATLMIVCLGFSLAHLRARRPFIRHALNAIGQPVCIKCGYVIGNVDSDRCPECGEQRISPHPQPLNASELRNPEIVWMMQRLGYQVCLICGTMWLDETDSIRQCPECSTRLRYCAESAS